jgi:ABC-type polysaccharide/polyol phosphate export permease
VGGHGRGPRLLGGAFYSINMLPPFWQKVTLFNPVVCLISSLRRSTAAPTSTYRSAPR